MTTECKCRPDCRCPLCDAESAAIMQMSPTQHASFLAMTTRRLEESRSARRQLRTTGHRAAEEPPAEPSAEQRAKERAEDEELQGWIATILGAFGTIVEEQDLSAWPRESLKRWADSIRAGDLKAARSLPKPYTKKRGRRAKAEAYDPATPPRPYTLTLARQRSAKASAGEKGKGAPAKEKAKTYDPSEPPRGYTKAMARRAA